MVPNARFRKGTLMGIEIKVTHSSNEENRDGHYSQLLFSQSVSQF